MTDLRAPLPANIEAEQALLGAMLLNNDAFGYVSGIVGPEHFAEPLHAEMFGQIARYVAAGKKATPVTLKDTFPAAEIVGGMTPAQYLARLAAESVANTGTSAAQLGAQVRDLASMRAVIAIAGDLQRAASDGYAPDEALRQAWERLDGLRMGSVEDGGERGTIAALAQRMREDTALAASFSVTTGLADLDRAIAGGWRAGRLYVVAGRPGMGKTVLAWSSARRVAIQGVGVSGFSLEIDGHEVTARLVSDELRHTATPLAYRDIVAGNLDEAQQAHREKGLQRVEELPIRIDASGGVSITEIEARARMDRDRFARQGIRPGVIFIDYLGLIRCSDRYRGRKVDELGEIALHCKNMAKRLDAAVVLLAQLNRAVESRDDKRPNMSDLRDSGNIEEHADVVGLMYRPAYYDARRAKDGDVEAAERAHANQYRLELGLGKNRLGPTITVDLWCDPAHSCVDNWQR